MNSATLPFPRQHASDIARAFLPARWWGNRYDYYYTREKLASDPLYPGVLQALRGSGAPVLDLGCGLGLLAHALRRDGQALAYYGVDNDSDKIARGRVAAARVGLHDARFEVVDLAHALPSHQGSVAILDVLQYLPQLAQQRLLEAAIAMLNPGARLVIRAALDDGSRRDNTTRLTDRMAHLIGWMQSLPVHYPSANALRDTLQGAGLQVEFAPLYGRTPFNHWLIVAARGE
ncbi:methyltransferase family protein [Luteimonas cucumeris]|uniref:Methyltransferase family protein n=1 Tax=Luteimonas cucumeris TaxID=985012 RepID=A0A562LE92_9GAMM|nr:class I SAM-dependent methyltransferase [Luteimonas cucumeris]TWI05938.1 methyltransferase family protein [Luteimonas cucumeris]